MSNPPRRSRPKKPGRTIDLKAETASRVGYAGPASAAKPEDDSSVPPNASFAATDSARDPETEIAAAASPAPHTASEPAGAAPVRTPMPTPATAESEAAALGVEGRGTKDGNDEARADGSARTTRAFAEDESLQNAAARAEDARAEDYDEDTILAAAVPDLVARESDPDRPSGPPAPSFDYSHTSSHPEVRGGGAGAAIGAGLLGAILALAGAGALQYAGVIPAVQAPGQQQPTQQFAAAGDVEKVANDLATTRGAVEQLQSAQAAGGAGAGASVADLTAVADRVTAIEQRAGQDNGQKDAASSAGIEDVRKVADAARQTSDAARQSADTARQSAETARQSADAARQAADAASQAIAQIRDTAGAAEAAAQQATQTAEAAQQAAAASQLTAAGAQQAAATAQSVAGSAAQAVDGFKPRIDAVEKSNRQAAIALSAAGLKAAIDRGQPFMSELEAYATSTTATGGSDAVTTLRSYAARGVPSSDALRAQWPDVREAVSAALTPVDPNADVKTQLFSGLKSLVNVRPAGPAPESAPGPQAALSRLDGAVDGGDLAGFLSEWEKLPDAAKEASRDFQDRVKARVETDRVVDDALAQAVRASGTAG